MITSFEIKNYKSIKSLSMDLPRFAVLVGPNGSGKTNVLRALELFGEIMQRGTTDPVQELGWDQIIRREKRPARGLTLGVTVRADGAPRGASNGSFFFGLLPLPMKHLVMTAKLTVEGSMGRDLIHVKEEELTVRSDRGSLRIATSGIDPGNDPALWNLFTLEARDSESWKTSREAEMGLKRAFLTRYPVDESNDNVLRILNRVRFGPWATYIARSCGVTRIRLDSSALRNESSFRQSDGVGLGPRGEGLAAAVDRLRGHGKHPTAAFSRVLDALQRVYPRIEDVRPVRVDAGSLTLRFRERGIQNELSQAHLSDGALHALALLIMLEVGPDTRFAGFRGILAIEEPENAIHPWSVRSMIERAQVPLESQVILTTHSETVVNTVADPSSLFIVENDDRKGTLVTPALKKEAALAAILSESGQRLGDVWMDGSLGGVPSK